MLSRFNELENTFALMDELWRRMDTGPSWTARPLASPAFSRVDMFDTGPTLVLQADLPGLTDKDVEVTLDGDHVSIVGERKVEAPEGYILRRRERHHVRFSRTLTLPCAVDPEATQAAVRDGVLTVTLTKAAGAQPRQIAVHAG
jgi:HSP20 family protein